ncbi:LolA family protein [Natronogracilivirga saccharolytica]|uniref:Outer membrane lipoprotein carrier protein LolA n=1 Tax=Natronogracilivirga saccharolytica TaxID=2812953 RepID=A0A8J7RGP2_9BACT|nr:outer membrane lipoprotein carrier protein LolA [Natronogracilivirga saccharolytica]MBP3191545.1 outer membrane lipoprotein carrier protein LolA [Natronogracilivirga saccharolytica]
MIWTTEKKRNGGWRLTDGAGNVPVPGWKKTVLLTAWMIVMMASGSLVKAYDIEQSDLDRVIQTFQEGRVFHAVMTHTFTDSYTGEEDVTEGEIWISQDKYLIRAEYQTILVDGETSVVYNESQNKVLISRYEPEEDDFAPSRFFSGKDEVFSVSDTSPQNGNTAFTLKPDDPFEIFTRVTIVLGPDRVPLEISAVDQMDNNMSTTFKDAEFLEDSDAVFTLDYPDDAEIIDLRK